MLLRRSRRRVSFRLVVVTLFAMSLAGYWLAGNRALRTASAQVPAGTFRNFESPQVHPLALTPDGTRLLAVNSPNGTLSVFQLGSGTPLLTAEIPVGLEPVSVAARNDREAWVVNWLSDSVSVVDLTTGNVTRTLDAGDEPTDILFAGNGRAYVCVAGGGHLNISGNSITGASGAVKVFDPSSPASAPQVVEIFGKQPRALARDAAGNRVFVSIFESGNQTTLVPQTIVAQNGGLPAPQPALAAGLPAAPNTALIVKWNGSAWADESGDTKWDRFVNYTLADIDLVTIDASGATPSVIAQVRNLGTSIGNMTFDPTTGRLYVVNRDSTNVRRFEPNLRGVFQTNRVTALDASQGGAPSTAFVRDLNPHVDFSNPAGTDAERAQSLALPSDIARASDGTLYVAATSSAKVGALDAAGNVAARIAVGNGPTGLALDEARQRLYVLNRHDETLSVVGTSSKTQVSVVPVGFNPEQPAVRNGRRFLYDAVNFSAHGTVSCASCHPNGHRDGLDWDLGDPTGALVTVGNFTHHPMKGPMMVQSLRGLFNATPLHWRADRRDVTEFNQAFPGILGSKRLLTQEEMAAFVAFVNTLAYPPNPNENYDRTEPNPPTGPNAAMGANRFRSFQGNFNPNSTFQNILLGNASNCNACHTSNPGSTNSFNIGSARIVFPGSILSEPQSFKVPQLRGIYQKAGMQKPAPGQPRTEQLTGFGFMHDGAFDTLVNFMKQPDFVGFRNDDERRDIEAHLLSLDSVLAPSVGLQATVGAENKTAPEVLARVQLLVQQAQPLPPPFGSSFPLAPNSDLVVRGVYGGRTRSFFQTGGGVFQPDSASEATVTLQQLLEGIGPGSELTFTGVPTGDGRRLGLDRDGNGLLNDDEPRSAVRIAGRVVGADGAGQAGVLVTLSGTQAAAVQTDALGRYAFNNVSTAGTHIIAPTGAGFTPQSRTFANPSWNLSADFVNSATANASDSSQFFVSQHYADFLNREPDAAGLQFWVNEIESCGGSAQCREVKRVNVSAAFFQSIEFQQTGYVVLKTFKAAFGDLPGAPVPVTYAQLMTDTQRIGQGVVVNFGDWQARLEANKQAFFTGFVQRPEFAARYPSSLSGRDFATALNANAGGVLSQPELDALAAAVAGNNTTQGRAAALRALAENAEFSRRESNRAFVLMQYYGYLRRNPNDAPEEKLDYSGYQFWLAKLEQFGGNFVGAEMVKAFITSDEYRRRFGQ